MKTPRDILELQEQIDKLPKSHALQAAMNHVVESTRRRRRIMNLVQEALSDLRLDMKYMLFDRECSKHEAR